MKCEKKIFWIAGDTPYPDVQSRDVASKLKQGYKMKKPEYCDDAWVIEYSITKWL